MSGETWWRWPMAEFFCVVGRPLGRGWPFSRFRPAIRFFFFLLLRSYPGQQQRQASINNRLNFHQFSEVFFVFPTSAQWLLTHWLFWLSSPFWPVIDWWICFFSNWLPLPLPQTRKRKKKKKKKRRKKKKSYWRDSRLRIVIHHSANQLQRR